MNDATAQDVKNKEERDAIRSRLTSEQAELLDKYMSEDVSWKYPVHYAYALPMYAVTFTSVPAMIAAVKSGGSHFFDKSAMRFFNSRVDKARMFGGRFYVTSEQRDRAPYEDETPPRLYTVRYWYKYEDDTLQPGEFGTFQQWDSLTLARHMASAAALLPDWTPND